MATKSTSAPTSAPATSAPARADKPVAPKRQPKGKAKANSLDSLLERARCEAGRHKAVLEIIGGGKVKGNALASRIRAVGEKAHTTERDAKRCNAALAIIRAAEAMRKAAADLSA